MITTHVVIASSATAILRWLVLLIIIITRRISLVLARVLLIKVGINTILIFNLILIIWRVLSLRNNVCIDIVVSIYFNIICSVLLWNLH